MPKNLSKTMPDLRKMTVKEFYDGQLLREAFPDSEIARANILDFIEDAAPEMTVKQLLSINSTALHIFQQAVKSKL